MTGLVVLDVVIGLIFIYLFYSLFCTVIVEIIATNLGLRARNLKIAIIRLLSDDKMDWKEAAKEFWSSDHFSDPNSLAKKFYDSPLIKYLGFSQLFKKPAWIGNETFVDGVFEILQSQGKNLSSLVEKIKDFFENPPSHLSNSETFKTLKFYFEKSNGDLDRFRENLGTWYDEIGERATGWYKKRIQVILFFVGLAVATGFNVDTIQITKKLSIDEDARQYFVEASRRIIEDGRTEVSRRNQAVAQEKKALDSMYQQSFEIQNILSLKRCDENPKPNCNCQKCSGWDHYFYGSLSNFLGCLITAFAISLGSPFWFDLLNKFMQLRSSVAAGATTEKKKLTNKTENGETIKG